MDCQLLRMFFWLSLDKEKEGEHTAVQYCDTRFSLGSMQFEFPQLALQVPFICVECRGANTCTDITTNATGANTCTDMEQVPHGHILPLRGARCHNVGARINVTIPPPPPYLTSPCSPALSQLPVLQPSVGCGEAINLLTRQLSR